MFEKLAFDLKISGLNLRHASAMKYFTKVNQKNLSTTISMALNKAITTNMKLQKELKGNIMQRKYLPTTNTMRIIFIFHSPQFKILNVMMGMCLPFFFSSG